MRAQKKYKSEKTKLIGTQFLLAEDADVIEKLTSVPNRRKYLVDLVRADIQKDGRIYHVSSGSLKASEFPEAGELILDDLVEGD